VITPIRKVNTPRTPEINTKFFIKSSVFNIVKYLANINSVLSESQLFIIKIVAIIRL